MKNGTNVEELVSVDTSQLPVKQDNSLILMDWKEFLKEIYGIETDFSVIPVPEDPNGDFPYIICRPGNLTYEQAFEGGRQIGKGGKRSKRHIVGSLDDNIDGSFGRDAIKTSYIVRISKYKLNLCSAIEIAKHGIITTTLMELLLFRDFNYYCKLMKGRNNFLVSSCITWCPGSKLIDKNIPALRWNIQEEELRLFPMDPATAGSHLIAKQVLTN